MNVEPKRLSCAVPGREHNASIASITRNKPFRAHCTPSGGQEQLGDSGYRVRQRRI